jgi:hypothetical protein
MKPGLLVSDRLSSPSYPMTMDIQIPVITEKTLVACGCRKFQLDAMGDHLCTCTAHSGAKKAHYWSVQESYIVCRIHYLIEHSTARQTPCLPSCKGTASHVRYECTQFTSHHHLLYSNLIPQHPVPLVSMSPNRSHQHPQHPRASPVAPFSPHLKDCPLSSRKLFCFSIFFCRSETHRSPDLPDG